jgi:superfamily I DNA/RNA helicase
MMPELRRAQADVLSYESGKMGVSAVPGSGKTFTLSLLAADLIRRNVLADNQEILIVTLVNSAVDNFSKQISRFTDRYQLPRNYGYRVRTLHGLANDIVRDRPELAGLPLIFVFWMKMSPPASCKTKWMPGDEGILTLKSYGLHLMRMRSEHRRVGSFTGNHFQQFHSTGERSGYQPPNRGRRSRPVRVITVANGLQCVFRLSTGIELPRCRRF